MFANCQLSGIDFAFPDVCLTPIPIPTPIPYFNISFGIMATPHNWKILFLGCPAHNMFTKIPLSFGDNSGINFGVISGTIMGSSTHITGSFNTLIKGSPATRLTSITVQNSINCFGIRIIPSQLKIMMLGV